MRITVLSVFIILVYALIVYKLQSEQVSSSEEHRKRIEKQSIREIRLPAVRGRIFTSDAEHILADNKVSFDIVFHLSEMRQPGKSYKTLDFILESCVKLEEELGRKSEMTRLTPEDEIFSNVDLIVAENVGYIEKKLAKLKKMPENHKSYLTKEQIIVMGDIVRLINQAKQTTARVILKVQKRKIKQLQAKVKNLEAKEAIRQHMMRRPGLPITIFKDLNTAELGTATELYPPIKGMEIVPEPERTYPQKDMAAHILGRVRRGDPANADDKQDFFYYVPDLVGVNALEKSYDTVVEESDIGTGPQKGMRGKPGKRTVLVDHRGYIHNEYGLPVPGKTGHDLVLTIDYRAQKIAEELLHEGVDEQGMSPMRAAFVLLDADSGAVLAMASSPTYDVDKMVPVLLNKVYQPLLDNPHTPLINRAVRTYTPGSVVKPLVGLALLRAGLSKSELVNCTGKTKIADTTMKCWTWKVYHRGHGPTNLQDAIKGSCNVYFAEKGIELGMDKITRTYKSAGLGSDPGLPIPDFSGLIPTTEKYPDWNMSDTARLSIGQGKILVSPLQAALYAGAIANGGTLYKPYLLKQLLSPSGTPSFATRPKIKSRLNATQSQLNIIKEGMWRVVNAEHGATAKKAKNNVMVINGKTGSAQMTSYKRDENKRVILNRKGRAEIDERWTNTWFIGFGTYKGILKKDLIERNMKEPHPERIGKKYSFAVFVEHGKSGGQTSAPIAGQFFERWLSGANVD